MATTIVLGDGPLGQAISTALRGRGDAVQLLGRPVGAGHDPAVLRAADVVVDASRAEAVAPNIEAALDAGCRAFVVATTGWQADVDRVEAALRRTGATAIVAPNLALGAALFLRLVDEAARLAGAIGGFEPSVLEWHRRSKADRPSGTAREIVRRLSIALPIDVDEVAVLRAGAMPGMHVVGLDGASETIELRLTARDRSGYAAGALAAVDWLLQAPHAPGIHAFDEVVDGLVAAGRPAVAGRVEAGTPELVGATA
ncbi:MAG TPA: dihydrodipicolinate reductase C-terminal domain-containing protein [Patescibacteria group bacterium]|nr:dihydrodipicolinate reductase C-terminal domain-containing protein [Patescibacteria group bacterium]